VRTERVAAVAGLAAVAAVMLLAVIHWETPYRVISKPLESRIHIGKEDSAAASVHGARPAARAQAADEGP
jgi:hypothetical protein